MLALWLWRKRILAAGERIQHFEQVLTEMMPSTAATGPPAMPSNSARVLIGADRVGETLARQLAGRLRKINPCARAVEDAERTGQTDELNAHGL